jgi:hypothetical protein
MPPSTALPARRPEPCRGDRAARSVLRQSVVTGSRLADPLAPRTRPKPLDWEAIGRKLTAGHAEANAEVVAALKAVEAMLERQCEQDTQRDRVTESREARGEKREKQMHAMTAGAFVCTAVAAGPTIIAWCGALVRWLT